MNRRQALAATDGALALPRHRVHAFHHDLEALPANVTGMQTGLPLMGGLPGLTVSTGLVGRKPVGVQLIGSRYREDLLLAGGAIEAGGVPPAPVEPAW